MGAVCLAVKGLQWPGVPPAGTVERAAFSASFWGSLYSGLIYAVVTGLLVGLALWLGESHFEDRRRISIEEVEVYRRLSTVVRLAKDIDPSFDGTLDSWVLDIGEIQSEVDSIAQPTVKRLNLDHKEVWSAAHELLDAVQKYRETSKNADGFITVFVRRFNHARGSISTNDMAAHMYIAARMSGWSDEAILPYLQGGACRQIPDWVHQCWEALHSEHEWSDIEAQLIASKYVYEAVLTKLRLSDPSR